MTIVVDSRNDFTLEAYRRVAPSPLEAFLAEIRDIYPPMEKQRAPGPDAGALAAHFGRLIIPVSGR